MNDGTEPLSVLQHARRLVSQAKAKPGRAPGQPVRLVVMGDSLARYLYHALVCLLGGPTHRSRSGGRGTVFDYDAACGVRRHLWPRRAAPRRHVPPFYAASISLVKGLGPAYIQPKPRRWRSDARRTARHSAFWRRSALFGLGPLIADSNRETFPCQSTIRPHLRPQ